MSRRADPWRIYLARHAAHPTILTRPGMSPDRSEQLIREWEADAESRDIPRLEATLWEGASGRTLGRAFPNKARVSRSE